MNQLIVEEYHQLKSSPVDRNRLLRCLATRGDRDSLETLAELMAEDPPQRAEDALFALAPLFGFQAASSEISTPDVSALFPRLLDGIAHASVAAMILDLANHLTRNGQLAEHPAHGRVAALIALYGQIVEHLHRLEENPATDAGVPEGKRRFDESCGLLVSLTNALRLIGDEAAIGKLNQALGLGHRRLRTEAAAALAQFGQPSGVEELIKMTGHAVVRNLALGSLDQLGLNSRVAPEFLTPAARAESDLASWLAEPMQFGAAPGSMQLIDHSSLFWPGFEEKVDCYLFEYAYRLPGGTFRNIGIAGPVVHSFTADMRDFPPADIRAACAGWQAEHDEMTETPAERFSNEQKGIVQIAVGLLQAAGFESIVPVKLGQFFGEPHVIATACHQSQPCVVVVAGEETTVYRVAASSRPLGPDEAYCIYKGRKLLAAFNESCR